MFPKWTNTLPLVLAIASVLSLIGATGFVWYWFSPRHLEVGYIPEQPIPYSHALHAGKLGIDCRYCHYNVERSAHAAIPPTEICMNCHQAIKTDSPAIQKIHESYHQDRPIPWVKVNMLPDYAYFDHSAHLRAGVSCVSCHGRVDRMEKVYQTQPLSMGWCLDCHREPEKHLRPRHLLTRLDWTSDDPQALGKQIREMYHVNPREDCNTCHR